MGKWQRMIGGSISPGFDGQNFARLTFYENFEWPAAHLTVCRKLLRGRTRVDDQFVDLPAERTFNSFADLH